jgi:hypothetical protein
MLDINTLWDESFYLNEYPDVAQQVASGRFNSGLQHFQAIGKFEQRDPSVLFETEFYLSSYPDVARAVTQGKTTAIDHFLNNGQFENLNPFTEFYTNYYLTNNPDVATAIQARAENRDPLTGIEHFVKYGQYENRNFSPNFDPNYYLQLNPDVAGVVSPGGLSAIKHYLQYGIEEGRLSEELPLPLEISLSAAQSLDNLSLEAISGFVGNANSRNIYSFTLNATSTVQLNLSNLSADADLTLVEDSNSNGLLDEFERLEVSNAQSTTPEEISSLLSPGTYYVLVEQFEGDTNYNLSLSATPFTPPADTSGNTLNTARDFGSLTGSTTLNEFVGDVDAQDVYRLTLSSSSDLNISLQDLSADADLELIQDTNGNGVVDEDEILESSALPDNATEAIATNALPAGTYFLLVKPFEGNTTYNLTVSAIASTPPLSLLNRTPDSSLTVAKVENSAKFSESGQVSASKVDSYYSFTVGESGVFNANLTGLTGDADVRLIRDFNGNAQVDPVADRNGNGFIDNDEIEVVAWQWERGTSNESIRAFLQPGTYFLQAKSFNKQTSDYVVNTDFTPAPSDPRKFFIQLNFGEGTQGLTEAERNTVRQAANRLEQVISYSTFENSHSIKIDVTGENQGEKVLASAAPVDLFPDLNRKEMPISGLATLNTNPKSEIRDNQRYLYDTMIHEFAHVLGIGTLWDQERGLIADDKKGLYTQNSYAGLYYGELLGTSSPTPVELTIGQGDSDLAHWNKVPNFGLEVMVEWGAKDEKQLTSQLTIASLRDIGFNVNYGAAEEYSLPSSNPQLLARQNNNSLIS